MDLFTVKDFDIFGISGFRERMSAITANISPKLKAIGEEIAPAISEIVDKPLYGHVAKHARRTVNPPEDTWVAIGAGKRGYKMDVHFKIAISHNYLRLLFEVGPEYYDKKGWAIKWNSEIKEISEVLASNKSLLWFQNEHNEEPNGTVSNYTSSDLTFLSRELTRRKEGQLVLGRRITRDKIISMKSHQFRRIALNTFKPLSVLFSLHEERPAPMTTRRAQLIQS